MNISGHSGFHNPVSFQQKVQEQFAAADADQDGTLTLEEVQSAAELDGKDPAKAEELFSRADTDGDGVLSAQEQEDHLASLEGRMQSVGGGIDVTYGGKSGSFEGLLESMSAEESDEATRKQLEQILDTAQAEKQNSGFLGQAASAFNKLFPRVDTTA